LLLLSAYAGLLLVAFGIFRIPGVLNRGYQIAVDRSLFTTVNAVTLTGFEQNFAQTSSFHAIGFITIAVLMLAGGWITLSLSAMAVVRIARLGYDDEKVLVGSAAMTGLFTAVGGALLVGGDTGIVAALFAAASTFLGSGLLAGAAPGLLDPRLHAVMLPLAVLGSLGVPTLLELWDRLVHRRPISRYSRTVLVLVAAAYVVGLLLLLATFLGSDRDWRTLVADASATAINARQPGAGISPVDAWPRPTQWIVIGLMLVGGIPASGAGGITLVAIAVIAVGLRRSLRDEKPGRIFGVALAWMSFYLVMTGVIILVLLATQPQLPADRAIFLAVSATGCVGLSHDLVATTGPALYVMTVAMLLGRFVPIAALWWIALREAPVVQTPVVETPVLKTPVVEPERPTTPAPRNRDRRGRR
jgi:Trk-type K+ transport system membrane component